MHLKGLSIGNGQKPLNFDFDPSALPHRCIHGVALFGAGGQKGLDGFPSRNFQKAAMGLVLGAYP